MRTFERAQLYLRQWNITLSRKSGEYRVNFKDGAEATAYYTNDLEDAIQTGRAMSREGRRNPSATVWVASGWFSDSDPFFSMAFDTTRFTKLQASKKFNAKLNQTAVDMWRGGDWGMSKAEFLNDVQWSGVFQEKLETVVQGSQYERDEILDELNKHGFAYLATN